MQILTAREIASRIEDGKTLAANGFIMSAVADELCAAIEQRFLETGHPRDLTIFSVTSIGDGGTRGLNRLAHAGLVRRVIAGHWNLMPGLQKLVAEEKAEGYNFPQDVLAMLLRDIAAHRPGHITPIGLDTFVDPRLSGGRLNGISKEQFVSLVQLDGKEYLYYRGLPIHYALLRGTTADRFGNISLEKEAVYGEITALAQAVHNSGGEVFAQVGALSETQLHPHRVRVPGIYVNAVAVAPHQQQTAVCDYNPAYSGNGDHTAGFEPLPLDERKIIARRAALELKKGGIVNLGIGMPEGVAAVAAEEGISDTFTLTVESGHVGGVPAGGKEFGCVSNPHAVFEQYTQFDFYHGGGLDLAVLGLAQVDGTGNINVSKFGPRIAGCGGFIGITQTAKEIIFCGTFTAKGLETSVSDGKLVIHREGSVKKFVREVEQITFSAAQALQTGRSVKYVTERAVFTLTEKGLRLDETAPGVDIQRDILSQMDFAPIVENVREMDARIFEDKRMGLR